MTVHASQIVELALSQDGKPYVFGAEVHPGDPDPEAFDCSELVEWVCRNSWVRPKMVDGSWRQLRHCLEHGKTCSVAEAVETPGALLFRFGSDPLTGGRPAGAHVAISLGNGSTIEAKSRRDGVGVFSAHGRKWTHAAKIPGVSYEALQPATVQVSVELPVLTRGARGEHVAVLQTMLGRHASGLDRDGILGAITEHALINYQRARGITETGAGAATWAALLGA